MHCPVRRPDGRESRPNLILLALTLASSAGLGACDGDPIFEGEDVVAPPRVEFREGPTTERAIHGGEIRLVVDARDEFVGVQSVSVRFSGVLEGEFSRTFDPERDSVVVDTALAVPFGVSGLVEFVATASNRFAVGTESDTVSVLIVVEDTVSPTVALSVQASDRMERTEPIRVSVDAADDQFGVGLERVGVTVIARTTDGTETILTDEVAGLEGASSFSRVFEFTPFGYDPTQLPQDLRLEIFAFAVDTAGNCAVNVTSEAGKRTCEELGGGFISGEGAVALVRVISGRTTGRALSGEAGDLVIDPARGRVYVSNTSENIVEVMDAAAHSFTGQVRVGSRPLGMTINNRGDTLIVANSGGTNLSMVALASLQEAGRLQTRNAVLFELESELLEDSLLVFGRTFSDFSDRPAYVAQDASGVILYSTLPTATAPAGTIQMIETDPAWSAPEINLLLFNDVIERGSLSFAEVDGDTVFVGTVTVTFVDSVKVAPVDPIVGGGIVEIYDHRPGFPGQTIIARGSTIEDAVASAQAQGSDVYAVFGGTWVLGAVGLADVGLLAASSNRDWIAIGEPGTGGVAGRVLTWGAMGRHPPLEDRRIADEVNVTDLVNNASQPITAVAANADGSVMAARSADVVFLFSNPLRLLGIYEIGGGAGIALHPTRNIAFAGTGNRSIAVIDPVNFTLIREIEVREVVAGPLRFGPAVAGDQTGTIGRLYGLTQSGGVLVLPLTEADLNR